MYIYPENLKGKSTMFLWTLRDMLIIIIGAVLSAVFAAALDWIVPGGSYWRVRLFDTAY